MRILSEPGSWNGKQRNAQNAEPKPERGARAFKSLSAKPMGMRQGRNKYFCAQEKKTGQDRKQKM